MKRTAMIALVLSFCLLLSACCPVVVIPNNESIGNPKTFEKDGITLTLTDRFTETPSQLGFYAYYTASFCGVVVLKEEFSLEEGLAEKSLEEYVTGVIANNGHTDIQLQCRDGLWYYVKDTGTNRSYSYSFKGSDAFWIVQYICTNADAPMLENMFFLWANCVEVD